MSSLLSDTWTIEQWIIEVRRVVGHDPATAFDFFKASRAELFGTWAEPAIVTSFLALDPSERRAILTRIS